MRVQPGSSGSPQPDLLFLAAVLLGGTDALDMFEDVELLMYNFDESYPKFKALAKAVSEFQRYIMRNAGMIVNCGERWRAGQVISPACVESLVNGQRALRFTKKQQMPWTPEGAHLLLQIRTSRARGHIPHMVPGLCGGPAYRSSAVLAA